MLSDCVITENNVKVAQKGNAYTTSSTFLWKLLWSKVAENWTQPTVADWLSLHPHPVSLDLEILPFLVIRGGALVLVSMQFQKAWRKPSWCLSCDQGPSKIGRYDMRRWESPHPQYLMACDSPACNCSAGVSCIQKEVMVDEKNYMKYDRHQWRFSPIFCFFRIM